MLAAHDIETRLMRAGDEVEEALAIIHHYCHLPKMREAVQRLVADAEALKLRIQKLGPKRRTAI